MYITKIQKNSQIWGSGLLGLRGRFFIAKFITIDYSENAEVKIPCKIDIILCCSFSDFDFH